VQGEDKMAAAFLLTKDIRENKIINKRKFGWNLTGI